MGFKDFWNGLWENKNYNHFDDIKSRVEGGKTSFKKIKTPKDRIEAFLKYPPLMKVISLQCTLFQMGKFYIYDKDGNEVKDHPLLDLLKNPYEDETTSQLLFDFMFWNCLGGSWLYIHSRNPENSFIRALASYRIDFPDDIKYLGNKIVKDAETQSKLNKARVKYYWSSDRYEYLRLNRMINVPDLSNSIGDWLKPPSRIDTMSPLLTNSEEALKSKNVNLRFSGKYLVAGKNSIDDVEKLPLSKEEALDIETKTLGHGHVRAVKSLVEIKRYVEDIAKLKLDDSYLADYFFIGTMMNIPKDVLESFNSSTFENQHLATGRHVEYCMQPKGDILCQKLFNHFYQDSDLTLQISWDHLLFMQRFRKEQAEYNNTTAKALKSLKDSGIKLDSINSFLDTNFEYDEKQGSQGNQQGEGQNDSGNAQQEDQQ